MLIVWASHSVYFDVTKVTCPLDRIKASKVIFPAWVRYTLGNSLGQTGAMKKVCGREDIKTIKYIILVEGD